MLSLFQNYLPLQKGGALHLNKFWIPLTQRCFLSSLVEIGPVVLEKKIKMWKVYDNNANSDDEDNNDDNDDRQRTNFDQKSSLEPSAQVS